MTNEEIVKKAMEKAVENGWNADHFNQEGYDLDTGKYSKETYKDAQLSKAGIYLLIFSHDFAKAFWGDQCQGNPNNESTCPIHSRKTNKYCLPNWKVHIKIMVLEKKPLLYLEKFL